MKRDWGDQRLKIKSFILSLKSLSTPQIPELFFFRDFCKKLYLLRLTRGTTKIQARIQAGDSG
jgi:hypothetical protein